MKRRTTIKATVAGLTAVLFPFVTKSKGTPADHQSESDPFFSVIYDRRSVRKFKPDPVPEEHLKKILDAARMAPTSGNQQPWKFLVVQNKKRIEALKEFCIEKSIERYKSSNMPSKEDLEKRTERVKEYYGNYLSAPVYVVILTDNNSQYPDYNHWDGPLATANLMLAARALGYGTVFCTDSINEDITKEFFNIPDQYTRVCITPIGVPYEWPASPEKKALESFIVRENF